MIGLFHFPKHLIFTADQNLKIILHIFINDNFWAFARLKKELHLQLLLILFFLEIIGDH
jgi:hypothetical protein